MSSFFSFNKTKYRQNRSCFFFSFEWYISLRFVVLSSFRITLFFSVFKWNNSFEMLNWLTLIAFFLFHLHLFCCHEELDLMNSFHIALNRFKRHDLAKFLMPRCFKTRVWLHKYCAPPLSTAPNYWHQMQLSVLLLWEIWFCLLWAWQAFLMWHSEKSVFWATASVLEEWPRVLEEGKRNLRNFCFVLPMHIVF